MRSRLAAVASAVVFIAASSAQAGEKIQIPRPTDKLAPAPPPPAVAPSAVGLPVSISVNALSGAVARAIPSEKNEKQWQDGAALVGHPGFEYQYYLWRGAPQLKAAGDTLEVTFPQMKFRAKGHLEAEGPEAGCGYGKDPMRRAILKFSAKLLWAPDGTLQSKTTAEPAELPDPCVLQPMNVDMMPVLKKLAEDRVPELSRALDSAIRAQSVSQRRLAALWKNLQQPKALQPDLWLSLSPSSIGVAPLSAQGPQAFKTSLMLQLSPRMTQGARPPAGSAPLPRIAPGTTPAAGFHAVVPLHVGLAAMNQNLTKEVVGTEFDAGPLGAVKVVSTYLYGSGNRLVVEVTVTGGMNGKIYVIGKPVFDAQAVMLKIEDLDMTIETKNLFAKAANAVARDKMIAELQKSTRMDLKTRIEAWRRLFAQKMNQDIVPGVRLQASEVKLAPKGVYPAPGGIEVQTILDANLRLVAR